MNEAERRMLATVAEVLFGMLFVPPVDDQERPSLVQKAIDDLREISRALRDPAEFEAIMRVLEQRDESAGERERREKAGRR